MLWPEESRESTLVLVHLRQLYTCRVQTLLARYSYGVEDLLYRNSVLDNMYCFYAVRQYYTDSVLPLCCDVKADRIALSVFYTRIFR